jgi:hypothetical protein
MTDNFDIIGELQQAGTKCVIYLITTAHCQHPPLSLTHPVTCKQNKNRAAVTLASSVTTQTRDQIPKLLEGLHSSPTDSAPGSLCDSPVLKSLCNQKFGSVCIRGGCTTTGGQCSPPELLNALCVQRGSAGAYVVQQAVPGSRLSPKEEFARHEDVARPTTPKQAEFVGCCVGAGGAGTQTCKKIRVGTGFSVVGGVRGLKSRTMDPLKQLASCKCYNVREFVHGGAYLLADGFYVGLMGTKWARGAFLASHPPRCSRVASPLHNSNTTDMNSVPQRAPVDHVLAAYPFTMAVATKVGKIKSNHPCLFNCLRP